MINKETIPGQNITAPEAWYYFFNCSDETELYISFVLFIMKVVKFYYWIFFTTNLEIETLGQNAKFDLVVQTFYTRFRAKTTTKLSDLTEGCDFVRLKTTCLF